MSLDTGAADWSPSTDILSSPGTVSPTATIAVGVKPSVFRDEILEFQLPAVGQSIEELFELTEVPVPPHCGAVAWLEAHRVERCHWQFVRPKPGTRLLVSVQPRDARTAGLIGGSLAIAALAALGVGFVGGPAVAGGLGLGTAGATALGAAAGATIGISGAIALNALLPPPSQGADREDEGVRERSVVATASNRVARWEAVPEVLGRRRVTPPMAALPYSENIGNQIWTRFLFAVSIGRVQISGIRFGQTDIDSLTDVEYEVREGAPGDSKVTLYRRNVVEERVDVALTKADGPFTRTTAVDTDRIRIRFFAPQGPYFVNSKAQSRWYEVDVDVEYRAVGAGSWQPWLSDQGLGNDSPTPRHWRFSLDVPAGQYEVRVTRRTGDSDNEFKRNDTIFWSVLQSFQSEPGDLYPVGKLAVVAVRIKAQGQLGAFNCVAHSYAQDYVPGTGWIEQTTSNPASLYRRVLQGNGLLANISDSQLDLPALEAWHQSCSANSLDFNEVIESSGTVLDRLKMIAARGRASPDFVDGKYTVVRDDPAATGVSAILTPRNFLGFRAEMDYQPIPQALRVRFHDRDNDWVEDERLVLDDGYTENSIDESTVQVLDLSRQGVTSSDLAWREGRVWLAHRRLRRERITGTIGLEHLPLKRGDVVALQHFAPLIGLGPGRITALATNGGGDVTGITLDSKVEMEAGSDYGVRIRVVSGGAFGTIDRQVVTAPGETRSLTLSAPISAGSAPTLGSLVAFGVLAAETTDMVVLGRQATVDAAGIVLTQAAPAIYQADQGPIPAWDPNVTLPAGSSRMPPARPKITAVTIEEQAVPGSPDVLRAVFLVIHIDQPSGRRPEPTQYWTAVRVLGQDDWRIEPHPGASQTLRVGGIKDNKTYEVRVKALAPGLAGTTLESGWSSIEQVAVPRATNTVARLARVTKLELVGQGNDAEFTGRNPTFSWSISSGSGGFSVDELTGGQDAFVDSSFGWYEVQVRNAGSSTVRRTERVTVPQYMYDFERNWEDAKKLGESFPAHTFQLRVTLVDRFSHRSNTAKLTVTNPAPATPAVTVTAGNEAVFVSIQRPADADFAGIIVWADTSSGFVLGAATEVARSSGGNIMASWKATGGIQLFVRVAAYDEFRDDPAQLNVSSEVTVTPASAAGLTLFQFQQITFTPDSPSSNQVSWTSGQAVITDPDGTVVTEAIAAGNAPHGGASTYLYYVRGTGIIQSTTSINIAAGTDRRTLAVYFGGTNIQGLESAGLRSASDLILTGTIVAGLIATGQAVITESAQIANAVVDSAQIADAAIERAKIKDAAVDTAQIRDGAIERAKIKDLAVDTAQIRDLAVETLKIQDSAVITGKVGADAITRSANAYTNSARILGTIEIVVQSATVNVDDPGFDVIIQYSAVLRVTADSTATRTHRWGFKIDRGGTTIFAKVDYTSLVTSDIASHEIPLAVVYRDSNPGIGNQTYEIIMDLEASNGDYESPHRSLVLFQAMR